MSTSESHYDYLRRMWAPFIKEIGAYNEWNCNEGMISAHGDKGYGYNYIWEETGIPFNHGMLLFLLSYARPYADEVRNTSDGFVNVGEWVVSKYPEFKEVIEKLEKEYTIPQITYYWESEDDEGEFVASSDSEAFLYRQPDWFFMYRESDTENGEPFVVLWDSRE
jgi:hypothetical protein